MTLKHLETLYWIWRLGSFTAAAERLHTTQSAVSMRIRDLERTIGQELFDRSLRTVRPTAKGQELLAYAERAMALFAEIRAQVADPHTVSGVVRLGVTEYIALTWLPDFIGQLNARFPKVKLELNVDMTFTLLDKLRTGELDLAFLRGPIPQQGFRWQSLGCAQFHWMAGPALGAPRRRLSPRDLDAWPILTLSKTSNLYDLLDRWFEAAGAEGQHSNTCNSLSVLASWTIAGLGVAFLPPDLYARQIAEGQLQILDVAPAIAPLEYVAVLNREHREPLTTTVSELAVSVSTFQRDPAPAGKDRRRSTPMTVTSTATRSAAGRTATPRPASRR